MRLISLTVVLFTCANLLSHAQGTAVARVLLAAVTDGRNRPMVDLEVDDFVVHEGGEPREVMAVRMADYPLVILLDNASHATTDFAAMRAAAARFVTRVGNRAVAVVTIADPPAVVAGFERDRDATLAAIEALEVAMTARRRPLQALAEAAALIRGTDSAFAAVVAVMAASAPDEPEPTGLTAEFVASRDILHVVTLTNAPVPGEPATVGSDDVLRDLATRSGGRSATIFSPVSFPIALDQIADRLASEMLVEYLAPADAAVTADVRIGVTRPGSRVGGLGVWR